MPEEPAQDKSALERAAERYLEEKAVKDKTENAAAGCIGVCCIAVVVMLVIGGLLTLLGISWQ